MTESLTDEQLQEMQEDDSRLRYEEKDLTKSQRHRRLLLAEVQRLREQNHKLLNGEEA